MSCQEPLFREPCMSPLKWQPSGLSDKNITLKSGLLPINLPDSFFTLLNSKLVASEWNRRVTAMASCEMKWVLHESVDGEWPSCVWHWWVSLLQCNPLSPAWSFTLLHFSSACYWIHLCKLKLLFSAVHSPSRILQGRGTSGEMENPPCAPLLSKKHARVRLLSTALQCLQHCIFTSPHWA